MPITLLIPFAELAGIAIGTLATAAGLDVLSKKVESYIEDNPENAQKIFAMIMPEQGLANILKNESGDEEVEVVEEKPKLTGREKEKAMADSANSETGNYSSPDASDGYASKRGRQIKKAEDLGLADKDLKDNYDPNKPKFNWKRFTRKKADGGMAGDKTYHQYHDQHVPMDLEGIMGYAHGGDIAIQGGVKNYLGEQKMVTVPQKWQSAEDHPQTELAYITNREKNLLLKKDLHDSLKGGANKGPEGVMSLNGWGDAPGGSKGGGKGGSSGGNNRFADYSYNKAERYATPKGVPIGPGGLRVGQGGNTTGALGTTGTGSNIDFVDQKYSGDGIFSGYRNLDKFGQPKMGLAYGLDRLKNFIPGLMGMAMGIPGVGLATNFLKNKFGKGVVEEEQTISPYQLNSLGKYVYNEDPKNMFTDNFSDQKINNVKANVTSPNGELIELGNNFANPGGFETPPASEYEGMWGNDLQNSMEQDYGMYVPSYPSGNPGGITSITNNELPGNNLMADISQQDIDTVGDFRFNKNQKAPDAREMINMSGKKLNPTLTDAELESIIGGSATVPTGKFATARNGGMMGVGSMFVNKR